MRTPSWILPSRPLTRIVFGRSKAFHFDAGDDLHALRGRLFCESLDRGHVVRVTAALLVQYRRDVARLPVVEDALHVCERFTLALDERRFVADRFLLLVDRRDLRVHDIRADLHVADRMIAVGLGVALPDRHAMRHQLAHRRLIVVVADDAARDPGGARADVGLVEHDDARAVRSDGLSSRAQAPREMQAGGQAVDAGADDDVVGFSGTLRHAFFA